jgi:hypothetical protein
MDGFIVGSDEEEEESESVSASLRWPRICFQRLMLKHVFRTTRATSSSSAAPARA